MKSMATERSTVCTTPFYKNNCYAKASSS